MAPLTCALQPSRHELMLAPNTQAAFQAEKRGLTAAARAFVPHPISDQTKEQLTAKATAVFDEVVLALTDPTFTNAAVEDDANEDDAGP